MVVREVLGRLLAGELSVEEAEGELRRVQLEELGGRARLDLNRVDRRGLPEVVMAAAKTPADVARLTVALAREQGQGLASRLTDEHWQELESQSASAGLAVLRYGNAARVIRPGFRPRPRGGRVGVLTAGSSDLAAAEEARMVIEACGLEARLEADLGVAGLHRLISPLVEIMAWDPDVLVVAAGMDGVLPGLVAGLVEVPVIGLPVSVGYGAGGEGHGALLTMLQSCSTGLLVVNIDNGVGAGAAATLIASRAAGGGSRRQRPTRARRGSGAPGR
ncbi:MAG TPA: nickel pincer cofactor biosynthesis protein LarB [Candidatus Dormibacteraeota bacterium]|nr:nickel pincer cofactor biosynthesis protein LarB [Candidatus Dormibacteraeota bacterium]